MTDTPVAGHVGTVGTTLHAAAPKTTSSRPRSTPTGLKTTKRAGAAGLARRLRDSQHGLLCLDVWAQSMAGD
jgi:hypothetical protein